MSQWIKYLIAAVVGYWLCSNGIVHTIHQIGHFFLNL
jgi:hypothetical protein